MRQRYLLIEPKYSDPDTFCSFIVGSDRVRASINLYADVDMLNQVAYALTDPGLQTETPAFDESLGWDFTLHISAQPGKDNFRILKFYVIQGMLDDGAPFRADVRLVLSPEESAELAKEITSWCKRRDYALIWKAD